MFVELTRPLADHKPGDLIEVDAVAADTLARCGYTRQPEADKSVADFLVCVRADNRERLTGVYRAVEQKALGAETGAQGGCLIPDELLPEILYPIQNSIFRSRALVSPMNSSTLDIPLLNTRNTPAAGQSPFFGGVVARWTEDGIALNQLAPQLQNQKLKAHLLAAYVVLSNTLLSDSPAHLARRLQVTLASAWSWHEEQAFLLGTGVGQPLGVAVAGSLIVVLSPGQRQSGELFRKKILDNCNALDRPVPAAQQSQLKLELANGSRILCLPGREETARCFSPTLLVIDEASRVADWSGARQTRILDFRRNLLRDADNDESPCGVHRHVRRTWGKRNPPSLP